MASSERMTHASRLRVLVAWTGGTAWEYGPVADHLVDEVQKAACGVADVTPGELLLATHHRALPTCPVCAVLIDEAVQMHVPPVCDFCIEPFEPRNFFVGLAPKRVAMKATIEAPSRCFHCEFWLQRVDQVEAAVPGVHQPVIVDGVFYSVGNPVHETPPRWNECSHLGFGGSRWDIRWNDGRTVTTHNLWHGGAIPEYYRMRLPQLRDNATFVKPAVTRASTADDGKVFLRLDNAATTAPAVAARVKRRRR